MPTNNQGGTIMELQSTGFVRRIDPAGRLVVPKQLRDLLGLDLLKPVEFLIAHGKLILRPYEPGCSFCGNTDTVAVLNGKQICRGCRNRLLQAGGEPLEI